MPKIVKYDSGEKRKKRKSFHAILGFMKKNVKYPISGKLMIPNQIVVLGTYCKIGIK